MHIYTSHVFANIYVKNYNCMEKRLWCNAERKGQDAKPLIPSELIKILYKRAFITAW